VNKGLGSDRLFLHYIYMRSREMCYLSPQMSTASVLEPWPTRASWKIASFGKTMCLNSFTRGASPPVPSVPSLKSKPDKFGTPWFTSSSNARISNFRSLSLKLRSLCPRQRNCNQPRMMQQKPNKREEKKHRTRIDDPPLI